MFAVAAGTGTLLKLPQIYHIKEDYSLHCGMSSGQAGKKETRRDFQVKPTTSGRRSLPGPEYSPGRLTWPSPPAETRHDVSALVS